MNKKTEDQDTHNQPSRSSLPQFTTPQFTQGQSVRRGEKTPARFGRRRNRALSHTIRLSWPPWRRHRRASGRRWRRALPQSTALGGRSSQTAAAAESSRREHRRQYTHNSTHKRSINRKKYNLRVFSRPERHARHSSCRGVAPCEHARQSQLTS